MQTNKNWLEIANHVITQRDTFVKSIQYSIPPILMQFYLPDSFDIGNEVGLVAARSQEKTNKFITKLIIVRYTTIQSNTHYFLTTRIKMTIEGKPEKKPQI